MRLTVVTAVVVGALSGVLSSFALAPAQEKQAAQMRHECAPRFEVTTVSYGSPGLNERKVPIRVDHQTGICYEYIGFYYDTDKKAITIPERWRLLQNEEDIFPKK